MVVSLTIAGRTQAEGVNEQGDVGDTDLERGRREQEGKGGLMRSFMIGPHDYTQ
jgi:hypothetical protein